VKLSTTLSSKFFEWFEQGTYLGTKKWVVELTYSHSTENVYLLCVQVERGEVANQTHSDFVLIVLLKHVLQKIHGFSFL
jgi:hypothetical protein